MLSGFFIRRDVTHDLSPSHKFLLTQIEDDHDVEETSVDEVFIRAYYEDVDLDAEGAEERSTQPTCVLM
jgi:hypothetical protein